MQSWFGPNVKLNRFFPIYLHIGNVSSGQATWGRDVASNGVHITASNDTWYNRYLVVDEVVEIFMRDQGLGWFGGSTTYGKGPRRRQ
jgi:hypothetical protein